MGIVKVERGRARAPKQPGKSPSRIRIEKWELMAIEHYVKGHSLKGVVEYMTEATGGHKFSIMTVSKMIDKAMQEWVARKESMVNQYKAVEIEKINHLEREAWRAWEVSCTPVKTKSDRKTKAEDGNLELAEVRNDTKESKGDAKFMTVIQWCIEMRCKLLGTEFNPLVQINNVNTNTVTTGSTETTTYMRKVVFKERTVESQQVVVMETDK